MEARGFEGRARRRRDASSAESARSEVAVDAIASIVGVTRSRTGCARRSEALLTWRLARPARRVLHEQQDRFVRRAPHTSARPTAACAVSPSPRCPPSRHARRSSFRPRAALPVAARARSSGVSRPRRRTAARRRPDCASSATRPSAASASLDDGEDDDEGNPTTDVTSPSRSADGKQPVPSPTSRLSNVCFVLCRPQGPANVGGIARVMNNFGITDLRVVALRARGAGAFRRADGRRVRSRDPLGEGPIDRAFADEARIMAVHAAHLLRDAGRFRDADAAVRPRLRRGDDGEAAENPANLFSVAGVRVCERIQNTSTVSRRTPRTSARWRFCSGTKPPG